MPIEFSIYLRFLHQDGGWSGKDLVKRYPQYPARTIYWHMRMPVQVDRIVDNRKFNTGRPRALSNRGIRKVTNAVKELREETGVFTSVDVQETSGITIEEASNRTIRRCLRGQKLFYLNCRQKGILSPEDAQKRLKFAEKCKRILPENIWTEGISFYLDGVGWAHKSNPCKFARSDRTRTWRMKSEGTHIHCTAKSQKEGTGKNMAKFFVAIAYGKGVIKCEPFEGHINGKRFADFVTDNFKDMFKAGVNPQGKLFLQDGDPSQNSALAKQAIDKIGARQFSIPPRSPDLNPIENIFHLVGKKIRKEAMDKKITKESFTNFQQRVQRTFYEFPKVTIDKTISSMNKRVDLVITGKGARTKY